MERQARRVKVLGETADIVALLLKDHMRTRHLLRRATQLTLTTGPDPGCAAIAQSMTDFFRYWSPLHELDEEQVLVPAVRAWAPAFEPNPLDRTVADHLSLDGLREELGRGWDALAAEPALLPDLRASMHGTTRALVRTMGVHMAWEEREVFPLFLRYVPDGVKRQAANVLLARRARPHREERLPFPVGLAG